METLTCGVLNFESYEVPQGSLEEALQINYSDTKDHTEDVFLSRFAFYAPLSGSIEDILARRPDIQPSTVPLSPDSGSGPNARQTPGGLSLSGGAKNGPKWTEVVTLGKIDSQPVNGIDLDELVRGQISAAEEGQDDDHDSNPTLATDRWGFLIDKSGGGSSLAAMSSSSSSQSSKQRAKESAGEKKWVQILQQWDSYSEERKKKVCCSFCFLIHLLVLLFFQVLLSAGRRWPLIIISFVFFVLMKKKKKNRNASVFERVFPTHSGLKSGRSCCARQT